MEKTMRLKLLASACLLAVLALVPGCGSGLDTDFERHLTHGKEFLEASDFTAASKEFRSAVALKPGSAEGHYNLGMSLLGMGGASNSVAAFRELSRTVELDPGHKGGRVKLAELYLSSRDFEKALKLAESVYREDGDMEARMLMASALAGRREFEKALSIMEEILGDRPGTSRPYITAAAIHAASGNSGQAETLLTRAVSADPEDFRARAALASFYYAQKRFAEAEGVLRDAAGELSDRLSALSSLAKLQISLRRLDEAEKTLKEALGVQRAAPYSMLAAFYAATGRPLDAEGVLKAGVGKFKEDADLKKKYAELLLDLGKNADAEKQIREVSSADPSGYMSLYLSGRLKAARSELLGAQRDLQESIKEEPSFAMSHYFLGLVYKATGSFEQAKASLAEAIRLNPALDAARYTLASTHMASGNATEALAELGRLLGRAPGHVPANLAAGSIYLERRDGKAAERHFTAAARYAPGDHRCFVGLGGASMLQGDVIKAAGYFEKALSLEAASMEALSSLAGIYISTGKGEKAAELIRGRLEEAPEDARLHYLLGKASGADFDAAESSYRKAAELKGDFAEPRIELGRLYAKKGEYEDAYRELGEALKADPASVPAMMLLALLDQERGEWEEAAELYKKALEADPSFAPAANNLAWLYLENGRPDRALPYAERAKEAMPDDPVVSDTLGWTYYKMGAYLKAASLLGESVRKRPEAASARFHLGMAYLKRGRLKEAKTELTKALRLDKDFKGSEEAREALKEIAESG